MISPRSESRITVPRVSRKDAPGLSPEEEWGRDCALAQSHLTRVAKDTGELDIFLDMVGLSSDHPMPLLPPTAADLP